MKGLGIPLQVLLILRNLSILENVFFPLLSKVKWTSAIAGVDQKLPKSPKRLQQQRIMEVPIVVHDSLEISYGIL